MSKNSPEQTTSMQLNAVARGAENFLRWSSSAMLRGGRVTKFKGVAASYSPELGLTAHEAGHGLVASGGSATLTLGMARRLLRWTAAPLALLAASSPAFAQAKDDCVLDGERGFICEDNGGPLTVEPALKGGDDDLRIVLEDGFDIDTSGTGQNGLDASEFNSVTIRQESGTSTIIGGRNGLFFFDIYGNIDIITGGDVTGLGGDGVYLNNEDGSLTLDTSAGTVFGRDNGIVTRNQGNGATTIITADVDTGFGEGGVFDGINAENGSSATDLTIDSSAGSVTAQDNGIVARNNGTGETTITTADVDGEDGNGIDVINAAGSGDIDIDTTAGTVFGRYSGIVTQNQGDGATTIITADVDTGAGEGGPRDGINAVNGISASDLIIDTSAGSVRSITRNGIVARNNGTGDTTITTADVTGDFGYGVDARNASTAGDLIIDTSAGTVATGFSSIRDTIFAENRGTGATRIITGDVYGVGETGEGAGIDATGYASTTELEIDTTAGTVTSDGDGILAYHSGSGDLTIRTAGVVSTQRDGIDATNAGTGDFIIDSSAGDVRAQSEGIQAFNYGTGDVSITTGNVTGTTSDGVYSYNTFGAGSLTIDTSAGAVSGGNDGIEAYHYGNGNLTITTADVSGSGDDGIRARSYYGDISINSVAGSVSGARNGINASQNGSGADYYSISITTADVSGAGGDGIRADNEYSSGEITIDSSAGAVTGSNNGIYTYNRGYLSGTDITTGDVTGESGAGIVARTYGEGGYGAGGIAIDSSAGRVTGSVDGIVASNAGFGDLSITTADVTGQAFVGIRARNANASTGDLTIDTSAGAVLGGYSGIEAQNNGAGSTTITTGDVSAYGENGYAIAVGQSGADLTLDTTGGRVYAYDAGAISATNAGSGSTTVTTADVVSNTGGTALQVFNYGADVTVDTSAGSVAGNGRNSSGIAVINRGTGAATITTANVTGDTAGGDGHGVDIYNGIDGGELILDTSAGAVVGAQNGVRVRHYGDGENATITTADVTGLAADGINVRDDGEAGNGADISIDSTLGTVTGAEGGIDAFNFDTGDLSITTANVNGEAGDGINATNQGPGTGDLTIDSTAGRVEAVSFGAAGIRI